MTCNRHSKSHSKHEINIPPLAQCSRLILWIITFRAGHLKFCFDSNILTELMAQMIFICRFFLIASEVYDKKFID